MCGPNGSAVSQNPLLSRILFSRDNNIFAPSNFFFQIDRSYEIISIKEEKEREREKERGISRANIGCFRLPTQRCHSREIAPEIHPSGVDEKKRNRKTGAYRGVCRLISFTLYWLNERKEKEEEGERRMEEEGCVGGKFIPCRCYYHGVSRWREGRDCTYFTLRNGSERIIG